MNVPSTHRTTQGRLAGCWAHGDMAKQRRGKPGSIGILATGSDRTDPFLRATGVLLPECWESWPWTEGRTSRETQPPCPRGGWVRGCSSEMTRPQSPGLLTRQRGQSLRGDRASPCTAHVCSLSQHVLPGRVHSILAPYSNFRCWVLRGGRAVLQMGLAEPNRLS